MSATRLRRRRSTHGERGGGGRRGANPEKEKLVVNPASIDIRKGVVGKTLSGARGGGGNGPDRTPKGQDQTKRNSVHLHFSGYVAPPMNVAALLEEKLGRWDSFLLAAPPLDRDFDSSFPIRPSSANADSWMASRALSLSFSFPNPCDLLWDLLNMWGGVCGGDDSGLDGIYWILVCGQLSVVM